MFGLKAAKGMTEGRWEEPGRGAPAPYVDHALAPAPPHAHLESARSTLPLVYQQWQLWGLTVQPHILNTVWAPIVIDSASKATPKTSVSLEMEFSE